MDERISSNIPHALKEGIIFSINPPHLPSSQEKKKNILASQDMIKTHTHEKIVEIQRQHKIALALPFSIIFTITILILAGVLFALFQEIIEIPTLILVDIFLLTCAFLIAYSIFAFMHWYYQFYIVTNKCIMHRHFFRIGGFFFEEVFLETSPEREIIRVSPNFFYGLLNIEDVSVLFQRPGLEIFVFKAPENAQRIEDALEEVSLEQEKK